MGRALYLIIFWSALNAFAAGEGAQTFTLDGRFYNSSSSTDPLLDPSINVTISVLDPTKDCVLYAEIQSVSTVSTNGYFTIQVGSEAADSKRTAKDSGNAMAQVFQNVSAINGKRFGVSANCTYTPTSGEGRYVRIQVAPSTTTSSTLTPDMVLDAVPNAIVAESLQGLSRTDVLAVDSTGQLSQANLSSVFSNTNYPRLSSLLAGSSTQYLASSSTAGGALPSYTTASPPSAPAAGSIWYDSTANAVKYFNGTTTQTLGASGAGLSSLTVSSHLTADGTIGGTLSVPGTIDLKDSGVTANTYTKVTVNAKGIITSATNITGSDLSSGTIGGTTAVNSSGNITTTGTVTGTTVSATNVTSRNAQYFDADTNKITVQAPALAADYSLTLPSADGSSGQVLSTDGSGNLSWATASGSSGASSVSATAGSAAAPTISFAGDTNTGLYSSGADTIGVAAGGSDQFFISTNGIVSATTGGGLMTQANGTAAAPTFSFAGDTDTGWFRPAANTLAASSGGTEHVRIDSSGNVGIGTTTPASALDVTGTISLGGLAALRYPSSDTTAGGSIAIGANALANQPSSAAYSNIAIGRNALSGASMTTAAGSNIAIGREVMKSLTSGSQNVGIGGENGLGSFALMDVTSGSANVAIGSAAGRSLTTGSGNTAVGWSTLKVATTGQANAYFGNGAGQNSSASYDTGIGYEALDASNGLGRNVAVGNSALGNLTSGAYNVAVGRQAGTSLTTGSNNVVLGVDVASTTLTTGSSNILIGTSNAVTTPASNTNNFLNISNAIFGTGLTGTLASPAGNVGIGTTTPGSQLDVKGTLRLSGSTSGYVGLAPAAAAGSTTYTLPSADGSSGQVLSTDGSGVLSWATASGSSGASSVSATAGSAAAPTISFAGDTNTGLYSSGADTIGVSAGGADQFFISSSGIVSATTGGGLMSTAGGTAAAPTFSFSGDADTGWFRPGANMLAASTNGVERVRIDSGGSVGIGTTTPQTALDISGNLRIGYAATACSAAIEGAFRWDSTDKVVEVCNGTAWTRLVASSGSGTQSTPSGSIGYFVVTAGAWNGNLGGTAGADAKCLSDLQANNWNGKADAVSRSMLNSSNVRAFICNVSSAACSVGVPNVNYQFAVSGSPTSGGATMTLDASGLGPNNSQDWSGANYFDGFHEYWTGHTTNVSTATRFGATGGWATSQGCTTWTANSGTTGFVGTSGSTNVTRFSYTQNNCSTTQKLVCWVHPGAAQAAASFSFTDLTNQSLGVLVTSNTITVSGITGTEVVSVSGGGGPQIRVNGGTWTTSGSIQSGDTLQVRLTTSGIVNTTLSATVLIGASSTTWQVTTKTGALKIFLTTNAYVGWQIGGLAGGDAICQAEAGTAGYAGSYKAILSDATTDASAHVTLTYPIVNAYDGSTVSATNLWNGSLTTTVKTPAGGTEQAWTGTNGDGSKHTTTCTSWTTNSGQSIIGQSASVTVNWLRDYEWQPCSDARRLYCIQQ